MSPRMQDYGHGGDKALVPGSLTVYRHFQVDLRTGRLLPMNYAPYSGISWNQMARRSGNTYLPGPAQIYEAECIRLDSGVYGFTDSHKAPHPRCRCGFYASYDPETDFYPSFRWGADYARLTGVSEAADVVVVKAACEVSGTVVMGRLGVRAQRMKINGMVIDWTKRLRDPAWANVYLDTWTHDGGGHRRRLTELLDDREPADDEVRDEVERVAERYGVRLYGSMAAMVEAHPKADVSALGVDTSPRAEADVWAGFAQQMQHYSLAIRPAVNATRRALRGISADFVIPDEINDKPMTAMEKAIEAKKKRPAPPGTGIDRRKRKL